MQKKPINRNVPFKEVIQSLLDETQVFPVLYLHQFSDLEGLDLEELKAVWPQIPPDRRVALLEDLENLAEAETIVSFDNLAIYALQDSDPRARVLAIRLLWESELPRLATRFIEMLNHDPDRTVRAAAATALGNFVYLGEIEKVHADLLKRVENSLLKAHQASEDIEIRRHTLESLGYSSRSEVPDLIRQAYSEGSPKWLSSALYAISRTADSRWEPEVTRMLRHSDSDVKFEAVRAAGDLELDSARRPLLAMLENDQLDNDLRKQVIWSLSKIGGEEVSEKFDELIENTEDDEEISFLEEAIDMLTFTDDRSIFQLMDLEGLDTELDEERVIIEKPLDELDDDIDFLSNESWDDVEDDSEDDTLNEPPSGPSSNVPSGRSPDSQRRRPTRRE